MQIHFSDLCSHNEEQEKTCLVTVLYVASLHHFYGEEMMSEELLKGRKEASRTAGFNFPSIFYVF